jgi:NAD(P)-dependent dehydrogenase (short-subunit alcohol dehydrogenase family)
MGAAVAHFGRVEAVVNNAGIGVSSLRPDAETRLPNLEELSAAVWDLRG